MNRCTMFGLVFCAGLSANALGIPQTIHVDPLGNGNGGETWESAFTTIEAALAWAAADSRVEHIYVAHGTYSNATAASWEMVSNVNIIGKREGLNPACPGPPPPAGAYADSCEDTTLMPHAGFNGSIFTATSTGADTTIQYCKLVGASQDADGGAISVSAGMINIARCLFYSNTADGRGGALFLDSSEAVIYETTFERNWAMDGGAIALTDSSATITCSHFLKSSADRGGDIFATGTCSAILDSTDSIDPSTENEASRVYDVGGSVYWDSNGTPLNIRNGCILSGVPAISESVGWVRGGVVYVNQGTAHISNSTLYGGAWQGGVLFLAEGTAAKVVACRVGAAQSPLFDAGLTIYQETYSSAELYDCYLKGYPNTDPEPYPASDIPTISVESDAILDVRNSTIINWQGKAIEAASDSDVTFINSISYLNGDHVNGTLATAELDLNGTFTVHHSCIEISDLTGTGWTDCLNVDPQLDDPANPRPLPGSPVIGLGDDASLPEDDLDINRNDTTAELLPLDCIPDSWGGVCDPDVRTTFPRIIGHVDMGAYEASCPADFNNDNAVDFFDYLDFVAAFDLLDPTADFNGDSVVNFFDYLDFVDAFALGC